MTSVFLCHSSNDKEFVYKLDAALRYCYFDSWLDERDLQIGDSLHRSIGEAIDDSDYVIPVLSASAVESSWVQDELSIVLAIEKDSRAKKVLPVVIGDVEFILPPFLRDRLYADFRSNPQLAIRRLVQTIEPHGIMHECLLGQTQVYRA